MTVQQIGGLDVDPARVRAELQRGLIGTVRRPQPFGPAGFSLAITDVHEAGHVASIIVTQADHADVEWLHASLSRPERMPDYRDLVLLKRAVFGPRREAYQIFPPRDRHVNIDEHALHLWGRADGAGVLPPFGADGTI